jgi:site-specific DNA-methyltransferase (cytosine-N4-specific)
VDPYYEDDQVTLYHGDALAVVRELPGGSVHCVVTSPPYYGLRDYGEPGQYGLESSPAEYVETMRAVFAEVRRVLAADGTLWLNIGDSYAKGTGPVSAPGRTSTLHSPAPGQAVPNHKSTSDRPHKNMLGIPWRVAFALQGDGWILRNAIVWDKSNAMPESVTDRLATTYELVFMLTRSPRYWFDLDAVRQAHTSAERFNHRVPNLAPHAWIPAPGAVANNNRAGGDGVGFADAGRNPGDVWTIATSPFPAAHFAVMAPALAHRCIAAGCRPGGTVLDPFCGSGTTGMVALKHGRRFVGIDLSARYLDLALRTRLAQGALLDDGGDDALSG